ncbi:MAG: PASTA domain-containing protein [Flavobacteriales bacterium]
MKHLLAAGVAVILILGGLYIYLHMYTGHNEHVVVPDVKGISIESAGDKLSEVGLKYVLIDSVYSPNGIGGSILEQNPPALAKVKQNRDIYLTIYRKTAPTEELKVKEGMAEGVAEIILKNKGIRFEKVYESDQVLAGMVIEVKKDKSVLSPDSRIMRGEKVILVVGKSSEEKVGIPVLTGLSLDSAEKVLQGARLTMGYPFYEGKLFTLEDSMRCTVQGQAPNPRSGKKVLVGTPIDLYLKIKEDEPIPPDSTDISNL